MNMALNTKLWRNGGSQHQTKNNSHECQAETTVVNANDNYERQVEKDNSELHKREDMVALNAKLKRGESECRSRECMVALNSKRKMNNGSERQNENEQWLWTPKQKKSGSER